MTNIDIPDQVEFKIDGERGAIFGSDRMYRYWLWRVWDTTKKFVVFVGLNPSTADEVDNDPTVERMERRARDMGYGGLIVVNIFAFRATDPNNMKVMMSAAIGEHNDVAIVRAIYDYAGMTILGWGAHGDFLERGKFVLKLLQDSRVDYNLCHLGLTKKGQPKHPLYIGYATKPTPWRIAP